MLKTLLIAAFLNGLVWIILTPIWQYPDEQSHFAQVQNIAERSLTEGTLLNTSNEIALSEEIMGTSRDNFGNNKFTYHPEYKIDYSQTTQGLRENEIMSLPKSSRVEFVKNEATSNPLLYYTFAAFFYKLFYKANLFTRIISIRFFSLLIFMISIFVSYQTGKLIFKNNLLSISLSSIFAFTPMLVYVSTGVLPDALTILLFTTVIYFSLKLLNAKFTKNNTLILIIVLFLGFITRQQFYISTLIILFPILVLILKRKELIKPFIILTICSMTIIYITNVYLTSVPIITNFRIADISIFSNVHISLIAFTKFTLWSAKQTIAEVMPWFWGIYKWLSLPLPPVYYKIVNRIVLLAIFGFLLKVFSAIREKNYKQLKTSLFLIWTPFIYFVILLVWNYFFFTKNGFSFGIQGRYYFPVIVPIIAILILGINHLSRIIFRSFSKYVLFLLICMILIFNLVTLIHVSASYYDASSLQTFITQVSQYKPLIFKGNIVIIVILFALTFQLAYIIKFLKLTISTDETL